MGFLIKNISVRDEEKVIHIRGCNDGYVEFVKPVIQIDKDSGVEKEIWVGYAFYTNIEQALDKLFRMRICNRQADTLQELLNNVREEREALHKEFESSLTATRKRR